MSKEVEKIKEITIDEVMSNSFGKYSKYIIQDRAIPDVRDGLKPVQRRILYAMHELGLLHNKPFKKSARVVGEVIGKYHPHGDSSIYEAMVRMSQAWKMNIQLIEMHGNNGSVDDDPAAAMRYTESRLSEISNLLLEDIKNETVKFSPNFDDSEIEPVVLPSRFPNLLVNGAKGIAAGYATEMPPHNLGEVIDAIITRILSPNCRLESIMNNIKGPDFPTGGVIYGNSGIKDAFKTGRGKIVISSKYTINDSKTAPSILITELPYGVIKSKLIRTLDEICFYNKVPNLKEINDISDKNGIAIEIKLQPNSNVKDILNYLLSKTEMQIYYNYNNVAISNRSPKLLSLIEIIDSYILHQKNIVIFNSKYKLKKAKHRFEIVNGLIKASGMIDEIINLIRNTIGSKKNIINSLMEKFSFTDIQANAIAELQLYRLSSTDQSDLQLEKKELELSIEEFKNIISNEDILNKNIINSLKEVKDRFSIQRRTKIYIEERKIDFNKESLIESKEAIIFISKKGYFKRFSNKVYESNDLSNFQHRENDITLSILKTNTLHKLMVFTNYGNYSIIPIYEIKENSWKDDGTHLNDYTFLNEGEIIIYATTIDSFEHDLFICSATILGKIKKTSLSDFKMQRYSRPTRFINLAKNDEVIGICITNGYNQLVIGTNKGKGIKYSEVLVGPIGLKTSGIKAISLTNNDKISFLVSGNNNDILGIISSRAGVKKIKFSKIFSMSRNGQGKDLFHHLKGKPHIPICASTIATKTNGIILTNKKSIEFIDFNNFDTSNTNTGFSFALNNSIVENASIIQNDIIDKDSPLLEKNHLKNEETIFTNAEKEIENIQINIDDILNNN